MPARAKRTADRGFTIASAPAAPPPPAFGAYAIHDLNSLFQCRFICTDEGQPVRYCGKPVSPRPSGRQSSWCCDHLPIVFNLQLSTGRIPPKKGRG